MHPGYVSEAGAIVFARLIAEGYGNKSHFSAKAE